MASGPFGARFDLGLLVNLFGGDVRSIAEAGRMGGPALAGDKEAPDLPGDTVCDLEGGGGGTAGLEVASVFAYQRTVKKR
jgi:NADPH-dependent 2,4-dienoyl-CoA reductase/sulfur reductase-like enzyme